MNAKDKNRNEKSKIQEIIAAKEREELITEPKIVELLSDDNEEDIKNASTPNKIELLASASDPDCMVDTTVHKNMDQNLLKLFKEKSTLVFFFFRIPLCFSIIENFPSKNG